MGNTSSTQNRIIWIDWAKAILIFLVCVGHFNPPEVQKQLIWGCHMPAFFIISGYLYHRHGALRTLYSFAVPMLFYTAIVFGVHIVQDIVQNGYWNYQLDLGHLWHRVFEQYFLRNADNPYGIVPVIGIWFVVALIVCRFLSGDIKFFSFTLRYRYLALVLLLTWLTVEPLIWDYIPIKDIKLYYGVYAMPFFLVGYIMKDKKVDISKIHPLILLMCFLIFVTISLSVPRYNMIDYQCGQAYIVFFVNAICGTIVLFWSCSRLPNSFIVKTFSVGTLLILTMHMPLDFFIRPIFHLLGITPVDSYLGQSLLPWFEGIIVMALLYYPIVLLNNYCPLLLGKLPQKTKKR